MEFIFEEAAGVDCLSAIASAGRIAALNDEAWDEAVEDSVIVVAIKAKLEKIAGCDGSLFGEEVEENITCGGGEEDLSRGLGLEVVESTHFGK